MATEALPSSPDFRLATVGDVLVVTFEGPRLTHEVGPPLYDLVENQGHARLVVNFKNVQILTSAPIGVLINLKKKASAVGGAAKLCELEPDILEILKLTHTADLFEIFSSEQDAIASF